jgi:PAS domain S-box-containing protein
MQQLLADSRIDFDHADEHEILHAVEIMNCGFTARNAEGVILYANQRMLEWTQYKRSEVVGGRVDIFFPPELLDLLHDEQKAIEEGDLRVRMSLLRRKDGTTFPVLVVPQRLTNDGGDLIGACSVIIDLGAVQTAKSIEVGRAQGLRGTLNQIALDLQTIALMSEITSSPGLAVDAEELAELSPREREVLALIMVGDRVPAIAKSLHISPHTVRNHLKSMFRKLGVGSQAELIERIRSLGEPDPADASPDPRSDT